MKWELKQSTANQNTLELYIYDDIQSGYYDWWSGQKVVSETSQDFFREQLEKYQNAQQINVYINSNGGDVMEAYGMTSLLQRHQAKVTCYVDGFAFSAAALFLAVADKVIMAKQATVLLHNMLSSCYGNAKDFRKMADDLDKLMEANRKLFLSRMNITEDELIDAMDKETIYTAQECLENGLCDEISGESNLDDIAKIAQLRENQIQMLIVRQKNLSSVLNQLKQHDIEHDQDPKVNPEENKLKAFFEKAF